MGKALFAILAALMLAGVWLYREPLIRGATQLFARPDPLPSTADSAIGAPTPNDVAGAEAKLARLAQPNGPDSVVLTPNEVASWIGAGMDYRVRRTYDSLRVELLTDTLVLHARLDTKAVPPESFGPFSNMLEPREPLRIAGTLGVGRPGTARFTPTAISVRDIRFPRAAVTEVARRVAGADRAGGVPVPVPRAVHRVAVRPSGVVLYRSEL